METIVELIITGIACYVLAKLIVLYMESKNIYNSPKCEHYGKLKKYVYENDMWMCEECENEFKQLNTTKMIH